MIYKLANPHDLQDLPPMDNAVRGVLLQYTTILSGLDATPDATAAEVKQAFDPNGCVPEIVSTIDSCPAYTYTLFLLSSDYGVVLVVPTSATPSELLNQI